MEVIGLLGPLRVTRRVRELLILNSWEDGGEGVRESQRERSMKRFNSENEGKY